MNNLHICPHCQQETLRNVGQSIDCANPDCDGYMITLPPEQFRALTAADFAQYKTGKHIHAAMDIEQAEFDARMAQLERDLAARQAARNGNEKTFG